MTINEMRKSNSIDFSSFTSSYLSGRFFWT